MCRICDFHVDIMGSAQNDQLLPEPRGRTVCDLTTAFESGASQMLCAAVISTKYASAFVLPAVLSDP
jgi:hypothetical protein